MAELQEAEARARLLKRHASAGDFWIPIEGTSMGSGFRGGDRVRVETLDRDPRFGEVWVFCARGGETVAHRFLRRSKYGFRVPW